MKITQNLQTIVIYLLTFVALSVVLRLVGIIDFSFLEISGYALIFYGVGAVYVSIGKSRKGILFTGTIVFLLGVVLFLLGKFDFQDPTQLVSPVFFFILGISFFMLYVDDTSGKIFIPVTIVFLLVGFLFTVTLGTPTYSSFMHSLVTLGKNYWPVLIILIGILFLVRRN